MKKLLLSVAVLATSLCASAAVYDFTGTVSATGSSAGTGCQIVLCNGQSAYTEGGDAIIGGLVMYAKNADATKEGIRFNFDERKAGQMGLVGNGGDLCIELDLNANDIVRVQYSLKGSSAVNFVNTGKSTPLGKGGELGNAAFNLTPDAGNVGSTGKEDVVVEKFTAITTGKAYLYFVNADIYKITVNEEIATGTEINIAEAGEAAQFFNTSGNLVGKAPVEGQVNIDATSGKKIMIIR